MSVIKENISLSNLHTFHINARARYLVELEDRDDIMGFLKSDVSEIRPRFVLGSGSNVLFVSDFGGVIVQPRIMGIEKTAENKEKVFIRVGAGEIWDNFVEFCVNKELGGIENLSWIPGTVGATPIQNIGAYGMEAKDVIEMVEAVRLDDGKRIKLTAKECQFSYRDSIFKHELKDKVIITHVTYRLSKMHQFITGYPDLEKELDNYPETSIHHIRQAIIQIRKNKLPDPAVNGNAGSFFKNPIVSESKGRSIRSSYPRIPVYENKDGMVKLSAAWLIEQCGWKGKRMSNTGTYKNQPLIIINYGEATGEEILSCARRIQKTVINKFGIKLEMEVNIIP
jgi:UDP-N-acetylmuramate dehydrogenase